MPNENKSISLSSSCRACWIVVGLSGVLFTDIVTVVDAFAGYSCCRSGIPATQPARATKWNSIRTPRLASQPLPLTTFVLRRPTDSTRGLAMSNAVSTQDSSLRRLAELPGRRYILVGGKGGVGKTSTSAAIAIKFADEGLRTLVLSTDPAHSLGDALMTDLSSGKVTPVAEQGGNLYALEVDLEEVC
jgi:hypothetical protein